MRIFDLVVLGTGPAATRVALACAEAGQRVAIVDPRPFGGTCALRGCNPKKVLVRAAELHDWITRAQGTGVRTARATIDWAELIAFKRSFTDPVTPGKEEKFREAGIEALHGMPRFVAPARLVVDGESVEARRHFNLPGNLQRHTLIYTVAIAMLLTIFFDLSRIASLGAVFYIVMDICIHWGVFKHLRKDVGAKSWILITAITLDVVVLGGFIWVKAQSDILVVWMSLTGLALVFVAEKWFLKFHDYDDNDPHYSTGTN